MLRKVSSLPVVCQALPLFGNGSVEYSPDTTAPYDEGTVATHICNTGFALIGNSIQTCQENGSFDGDPPLCEGRSDIKYLSLNLNTLQFRIVENQTTLPMALLVILVQCTTPQLPTVVLITLV